MSFIVMCPSYIRIHSGLPSVCKNMQQIPTSVGWNHAATVGKQTRVDEELNQNTNPSISRYETRMYKVEADVLS